MKHRFFKTLAVMLAVTAAWPASAYDHSSRGAYKKAFKRWTRSDELYQRDDFYASISWHATWQTPEFVNARSAEVGRIYDHSPAEENDLLRAERARFGGQTAFFLSFYAYDRKDSDLAAKEPQWRLRLEVDGRFFEPARIEAIEKPKALEKQIYPFINPWSRHYLVYFPGFASLRPENMRLHVNGPHTHGILSW